MEKITAAQEMEYKVRLATALIPTSSFAGISKADAGKIANKIYNDLINGITEDKKQG